MSFSQADSGKWLPPGIFFMWAGGILYLLLSGRYTAFLRPEFALLLWPAAGVAVALGVSASGKKGHCDEAPYMSFPRALTLVLPLLFLLILPGMDLGNNAFSSRFTGSTPVSTSEPPGPSLMSESTTPEATGTPSIRDLFEDPESYRNRQVTIEGMFVRDERLVAYYGVDTAVYRFLITCCAADALPLAVGIPPEIASSLRNDQWIRIEGVFAPRRIDDEEAPFIDAVTVSPMEKPERPYLY